MLEKYRKNIELLKQAVETDAVIRPIAKHRKPDGSLDIEGNLLLWNKALEPFEKTIRWTISHKIHFYIRSSFFLIFWKTALMIEKS